MLSIVLPCYNPPENWAEGVWSSWQQLAPQLPEKTEIIVVNDGSTTGVSSEDITRLQQQIPAFLYIDYSPNKGKGYALREGMKKAKGDILIYTDIDFPYKPESLIQLFCELDNGNCDVAVGVKDEAYYNRVPLPRKVISRSLRYLIKILLHLPVTDTQCGLKGFTRKALPIFSTTTINRYLFDLEFINNSFEKKLKVITIPVSLKEGVLFRKMNYKILISEMVNFIRIKLKRN